MPSHKAGEHSSWSEGDVSSGEGTTGTKPPFGKRMKRNCAKWWWLYLLLIVIIAVVVIIPLIFVGGRNMAQSALNKATVVVNQQILTNPGPNSFKLVLNTTVTSHTDRSATIEAFNGSFYLPSIDKDAKYPFIYADFPAVKSAAVNSVNVGQNTVPITNMTSFIEYNKMVLLSETFEVGVKGKTHVVLSNLPKYPVTWDKVITMKGFNKFSGLSIDSLQFHAPALFDGATMTGKVSIPNPSVISAQFGNLTLNLAANGTSLGYSVLQYVDYKPGNNTFDMRGYVDLNTALAYTHDYLLDLEITGNSSVNIGGQHLPYFEAALKANPMTYQLNITRATSSSGQ